MIEIIADKAEMKVKRQWTFAIILIFLLFFVFLAFFLIKLPSSAEELDVPFFEGKQEYTPPRSQVDLFPVEEYYKYVNCLSAVRHAALNGNPIPSDEQIKNMNVREIYDLILSPKTWDSKDLTEMDFFNMGFEKSSVSGSGEFPSEWSGIGQVEYVDEQCFKGKKCLYVEADDSDTGYVILNSFPVKVETHDNYTVTVNINCIDCENNSAYIAIIWLRNKSMQEQTGFSPERARHVLYLHNTQGYEPFTISVQAPGSSAYAVFGLRVHVEAAYPNERTVLYIDS